MIPKEPPIPEITPLLRPEAAVMVSDWLPRLVAPDPLRLVRDTGLVAAAMEKLPLLLTPLEAAMEPLPNRARVEPLPIDVAPV